MKKEKVNIFVVVLLIITGFFQTNLTADVKMKLDDSTQVSIESIFRSYLLNDQRIQWSGMETTFGVEAAFSAQVERQLKKGSLGVLAEFFLNQPFDKNQLVEGREQYLANFQVDTFEIARLEIRYQRGDFALVLGKGRTPFGRTYSAPFSNAYLAQPFIRTEAVLRHETGLFLKYSPGILDFDLAVVNGSTGMDTNSSKAGILRVGLKGRGWAFGVSAKFQDGIGSEWQKQFKNHAGLDWMFQTGRFRFFGEVIYDEYGFHREFSPDEIFWPQSLYYRDIFYKHKEPITGIGGYAALQYRGSTWMWEINYGLYQPEEIGYAYHDEPIHRAILKMRLRLATRFFAYFSGLVENERPGEDLFAGASPYALLLGLQYIL